MVWHIRGNRILSNKEALAEDAVASLEGSLGLFAFFFVMSWWLFGLDGWGLAFLLAIAVGVLSKFFAVVEDWGWYFCAGVLAWKALHWGAMGSSCGRRRCRLYVRDRHRVLARSS